MSNGPQVQTGEICWYELASPNVQAAKDFYGKAFGWQFADHDMGDMTYTVVKANGKDFGGIWAIPKELQKEIPPHWLAYILVADLDKSVEETTKLGAKVVKPATQVSDFGRFAVIVDPTGAHIALWQNLKS